MDRIVLRALEPEDLDILYEIENDVMEWGVSCTNVPYSRYALKDYIANNSYDIYTDKQLRQIISNEEGIFLGIVDLINFDPRHLRAEISILVKKQYRRKEIAKQALGLLIEYSKTILHINQLYAIIPENNVASINLFSGLGFEKTSILYQWLHDGDKFQNALIYQFFLKKE